MLNRDLNPFDREITMWDLNMVYCDGLGYGGVPGIDGAWYFDMEEDG